MHTDDMDLLRQMYHSAAESEMPDADGVTILRTTQGNEYRFFLSMREPFETNLANQAQQTVNTLTQRSDTHVLYLLHIWKNGCCLDLPPHTLRKALTELHPENQNALLMLQGETGFIFKSMVSTL